MAKNIFIVSQNFLLTTIVTGTSALYVEISHHLG